MRRRTSKLNRGAKKRRRSRQEEGRPQRLWTLTTTTTTARSLSLPRFLCLTILLVATWTFNVLPQAQAAAAAPPVDVISRPKLTMPPTTLYQKRRFGTKKKKETNDDEENDQDDDNTENNNKTVTNSRTSKTWFRWWNKACQRSKKRSWFFTWFPNKKKKAQNATTTATTNLVPTPVKQFHSRLMQAYSTFWEEHWKRLQEQRDLFLDKVALVSSFMVFWTKQDEATAEEAANVDLDAVTQQSDLRTGPPRSVHIVTTAALPWYTGTAINPLLRAAYLYQSFWERQQQQLNDTDAASLDDSTAKDAVSVTLVVPWLERPEDQELLYHETTFQSPADQEAYIRNWLRQEARMSQAADGLEILFYPARYHHGLRSIFAMGDLIQDVILKQQQRNSHNVADKAMNSRPLDVCILEEPEHCNWFRAPGDGWTKQFQYVVGIIHTNYKEYAAASHYAGGLFSAPALAMICSAMVRAYCHKVVKLSDTLQTFSPGKEITSNVHGVREEFWQQGLQLAQELREHEKNDRNLLMEPRVYFLGKLLWAKGLDLLMELQEYYKQSTESYFDIDVFGSGPDAHDIQRAYSKEPRLSLLAAAMATASEKGGTLPSTTMTHLIANSTVVLSSLGNSLHVMAKNHWSNIKSSLPSLKSSLPFQVDHIIPESLLALPQVLKPRSSEPIPARFLGRVDHAHLPHNYTVFVNPSISEVLCTATAEALAMGKFAIIPYHPSNFWFFQFPNCLPYRSKLEFAANLRWAMSHNPEPLTAEQARQFSWQAATERLYDAAAMTHAEARAAVAVNSQLEGERIAWLHNEVLGKGTRGDLLRRMFGAGPVSEQVRYQQHNNNNNNGVLPQEQQQGDDDEEEGRLGQWFLQSWFATSIQNVWNDLAKVGIVG